MISFSELPPRTCLGSPAHRGSSHVCEDGAISTAISPSDGGLQADRLRQYSGFHRSLNMAAGPGVSAEPRKKACALTSDATTAETVACDARRQGSGSTFVGAKNAISLKFSQSAMRVSRLPWGLARLRGKCVLWIWAERSHGRPSERNRKRTSHQRA